MLFQIRFQPACLINSKLSLIGQSCWRTKKCALASSFVHLCIECVSNGILRDYWGQRRPQAGLKAPSWRPVAAHSISKLCLKTAAKFWCCVWLSFRIWLGVSELKRPRLLAFQRGITLNVSRPGAPRPNFKSLISLCHLFVRRCGHQSRDLFEGCLKLESIKLCSVWDLAGFEALNISDSTAEAAMSVWPLNGQSRIVQADLRPNFNHLISFTVKFPYIAYIQNLALHTTVYEAYKMKVQKLEFVPWVFHVWQKHAWIAFCRHSAYLWVVTIFRSHDSSGFFAFMYTARAVSSELALGSYGSQDGFGLLPLKR